jgi:hypothetical protein
VCLGGRHFYAQRLTVNRREKAWRIARADLKEYRAVLADALVLVVAAEAAAEKESVSEVEHYYSAAERVMMVLPAVTFDALVLK